jgi:transposase
MLPMTLQFIIVMVASAINTGKLLTPDERRKCCDLVKPATILAWFRQLAARKYDSSKARRGRPPKPKDVRKLVIKLATENLRWGYTKIRDALRTGLGIEIGRTTVANILAEAGIEPAPKREKSRTWTQFMKAHWQPGTSEEEGPGTVRATASRLRYPSPQAWRHWHH